MKEAVVTFVLLWAGVWPLIHRGLVARYDLNPWKHSGWAMYSTPKPPIVVAVLKRVEKGHAVLDERTLPSAARDALDRFRTRRHAIGKFAEPRDAAQAILETSSDVGSLVVMVQTFHLDPTTARMTSVMDRYVYSRRDFR